ncbi:hypothetical protein PHLCEN_2v1429 [Hermanssonia centrifuga]|uniref:Helicase C-terminal domain-containing protein n=1 Tax=Hermanssonia centrifuga TaxID=98765 RepID=A0A2R6RZZ9_9APHY|nr:hypothetical protein PHLCEN_2v1429 [Hermanssonia centrifuga]
MVEWGKAVSEEEHHRLQLIKLRAKASKASSRKSQEHRKEMSSATKADTAAQFLAAQDRLKSLMSEDQGNNSCANAKLLRSSPLAGVRIGTSTSSKLNYILNDVRKYATSEKFLIFSRSPMTLVYIAESLGMIGVQYKLIWQKSVRQLEQDVTTFESSDIFRVFLMELKHGARGLNLITASRVIFCEPVWQADVETQAIKRVHRIGQTSPVTVKTLAIRSTAEEVMVARRDALKRSLGSGSGKLPNLTDDRTMRDFIANPTFLPETTTQEVPLDFPFLHIPNDESSAEEDHKLYIRIPASSPAKRPVDALTVSDTDMPAKKQKTGPTVRFDV